jgi:hypothetical protein
MSKEQILQNHLAIWMNIAIELAEENDMLRCINNEWWRATTKIAEFFYNNQTNKTNKPIKQYVKNESSSENRNRNRRNKHGSR